MVPRRSVVRSFRFSSRLFLSVVCSFLFIFCTPRMTCYVFTHTFIKIQLHTHTRTYTHTHARARDEYRFCDCRPDGRRAAGALRGTRREEEEYTPTMHTHTRTDLTHLHTHDRLAGARARVYGRVRFYSVALRLAAAEEEETFRC